MGNATKGWLTLRLMFLALVAPLAGLVSSLAGGGGTAAADSIRSEKHKGFNYDRPIHERSLWGEPAPTHDPTAIYTYDDGAYTLVGMHASAASTPAARGADDVGTALTRMGAPISGHAAEKMAQFGVSERMVNVAFSGAPGTTTTSTGPTAMSSRADLHRVTPLKSRRIR